MAAIPFPKSIFKLIIMIILTPIFEFYL